MFALRSLILIGKTGGKHQQKGRKALSGVMMLRDRKASECVQSECYTERE
jgi:hypothetical protein